METKMMLIISKLLLVLISFVVKSEQTTIKIGVLLMTEATEPFDLRRTGPSLEIGFEDALAQYGINFDVMYHNYSGFCPKETAIGHLSELHYTHGVKAVIGPACSGTIIAAGRLAQYLKLPMVTGLGDLVVRDSMDADMYESLTILSYNLRKLSTTASGSSEITIKVGVLLMSTTTDLNELSRTRPALDIAFEDAFEQYGVTFEVVYNNLTSACATSTVSGVMSEFYYISEVQALMGPVCSGSLYASARLAQYLRLPLVTGQGYLILRDSDNGDLFNTLTKLSFDIGKLSTQIKIGVILMEQAPEPFDMRRVGPAIDIAIETVQTEYGITLDLVRRNYSGVCPYEPPVGILSDLYHNEGVKGVLGPACSQGLLASARLAQYLNIPMVTGLGDLVVRQDNVDMFTSLTILSYNLQKISYSISAIMDEYHWRHTAILYDQTYVFFDLAGSNLVYDFRLSSKVERPYDLPFIPEKVSDYGDLLIEASNHARVFIIFCDSDLLRDILYRAYHLGMTNGDYVFITMELFPSDWLGYYTDFLRGDEKDVEVTRAYESLLLLTLRQPDNPEYEVFAEQVKLRAKRDYGYEFGPDEAVNYFITAFYDSAMYLALSYKTVLDEGGDIDDGMAVAQRLWNSTFQGITGPVKVDTVGNRVADFDLFDMKSPDTREFQLVGRFRGATQQYVTTDGIQIVWPKTVPIDMPRCGFSNELCTQIQESNTTTIIVVCVTIITVSAVALVVISLAYRKIKAEQELGRRTWLVEYSDVQIRKGRLNDSFLSKSLLTLDTKEEVAQVFTQTGYCKNQTVAIRKLHLKNIEITRQVAVEFRQMQQASHGNIAKFVGACLDNQHSLILMEYCPRGSLQDMLQNDSIELDWSFRYSLINDVIQGMVYLQNSPIHVHGRLSSTNCVIDSRFALKLTDYGPKSILAKDKVEERRHSFLVEAFNKRKLLWTAPEHLSSSVNGAEGASQKGDVYSFGIILQEIAMRAGPFEGNPQDVDEILRLLLNGDVIRPVVPPDACSSTLTSMMKNCWLTNAADRPSFHELDESFRKMRAGHTTNIMDNLLQRMSNYADNLEALAAERTKAYLDEKQKVEELLHRLLPPSVARQLQSGQPVSPESFDCVTIYFSDIVGFTTLCSKSSPIEVVDLLNDLYTTFDNAIDRFKVYKVETIGDAYMCVSGLPERIGNFHVTEICNMALVIIDTVTDFVIKHMSYERLQVRIGVHSGPVVAGVVGLTMPRYCLFGDTVNTASRMESTSEPLKIQLSSVSKALLEEFPAYQVEERGEIEIKGKGTMTTYWLTNTKEDTQSTPGSLAY